MQAIVCHAPLDYRLEDVPKLNHIVLQGYSMIEFRYLIASLFC